MPPGGELLGVSDSGSYGCEVASTGKMVLCNKNQDCTVYSSVRSPAEQKRILGILKLNAKAASKQ